jgi:hypothetical protein
LNSASSLKTKSIFLIEYWYHFGEVFLSNDLIVVGNWGMSVDWSWGVGLDDWSWVCVDWSGLVDDCVESIVVIGGVVNGSDRTISFDQRVLSLNNISVAWFMLGLDVSGMWVLDSVVEGVFWVGNGLWDDDFMDWSVGNVGWSSMVSWSGVVSWQWSVDGAGGHRCDEESGNNEALGRSKKRNC